MYAYAHATLEDETNKKTVFSSGDKPSAFIRGFVGFYGLANIFAQQMAFFQRFDPSSICTGLY